MTRFLLLSTAKPLWRGTVITRRREENRKRKKEGIGKRAKIYLKREA